MGQMKDTLGDSSYPLSPGFKERTTSRDAAASMKTASAKLRNDVLAAIIARPSTADEVAATLGRSVLAIRPRVSELREFHEIESTGQRRNNDSGRGAIVWRVKMKDGSAQ